MKQYEYLSALKIELDKQLSEYLSNRETLETNILDQFQIVGDEEEDEDECDQERNAVGEERERERAEGILFEEGSKTTTTTTKNRTTSRVENLSEPLRDEVNYQ